MVEVVFVLDESGAKGYSNNPESTPGELGVMAGYLVPLANIDPYRTALDTIRIKFLCDGKVHITELPPLEQQELRRSIFDHFEKMHTPWVYEAIYAQGFFENANRLNKLTKDAHDSRRSNIQVSWRENRELLHSELFLGAFSKAVAFCLDYLGDRFKLNVITDRTDTEIIKQFQSSADEFLQVGQDRTFETTGFDKDTKRVVRGSVTTKIESGIEALGNFSGISYSIACEDSSLTLAADVLVNSVNYHLGSHQSKCPGMAINTEGAISDHPLRRSIYGAWGNTQSNYFSDAVFMHPKQFDKRT